MSVRKHPAECPKWLAMISNKTLPPFLFLLIGILALFVATQTDSPLAEANLKILGAFSGVFGLYILGTGS